MPNSLNGWDTCVKSTPAGRRAVYFLLCLMYATLALSAQTKVTSTASSLPRREMAKTYFGADAPWYLDNVPFFEIDNPEIQQIYYYRWKVYRAHLRDLGDRGYIVTEFLDDVGWDKHPYASLNDATGFHIYDGRWLKDDRYMNDYIDYMFTGGGNDRHFSEAIADATYARFLVNGDAAFATKHLDVMRHIFRLWDDHFDFDKGLYFIEPIADATEYSIASIDASGGKDGFFGGQAFRPTINSYMYANAVAIGKLAAMQGDKETASEFEKMAAGIKSRVEQSLWNQRMQHFVDRYHADNRFVKYWTFVRGRELEGYVPWYFNLPDNDAKYTVAWQRLLSESGFLGAHGLRTNEPSFPYYMKQFRHDRETGKPECQWNGPSWPYQTTQVLGAMANLLNDYSQKVVSPSDYVRLFRLYTHQHFLNGAPDLQEDYNPDTGAVIVGLPRSHHYNHSGYIDLVISGLVGLRPRADQLLEVHPLIPDDPKDPSFIRFFRLEDVAYHGHLVTVQFDYDGKHYGSGEGLSVYVDGALVVSPRPLGRVTVEIPPAKIRQMASPRDVAVNLQKTGFPAPSSSVQLDSANLYRPLDGRIRFFPEAPKGWSNRGSRNSQDWYAVDLGEPQRVSSVSLYFYEDGAAYKIPTECAIEYRDGSAWKPIPGTELVVPVANGETRISFPPLAAREMRVTFRNPSGGVGVLLHAIKIF